MQWVWIIATLYLVIYIEEMTHSNNNHQLDSFESILYYKYFDKLTTPAKS